MKEPGTATLLDFGIAKLLEGEGGIESSTTGLEWRLTPLYAAPEQIRGERVAAATRRLLVRRGALRAAHRREPPRLSRQRAWRSAVRPDLDRIVMKAMRREPAGRYQSVQALVDDLERWRRHEPVRH